MKFHLGDILTIITDRMLSPTGVDGIYKILNYMTQDNLFTHQLPRAAKECKPYLLKQYPQLDVSTNHLDELIKEFGPGEACKRFVEHISLTLLVPIELEVNIIPNHEYKDPIKELEDMVGKDKVIVVKT